MEPQWSRDGSHLYFRNGGQFLEVPFDGGGNAPELGRPTVLFETDPEMMERLYSVAADRERIVITQSVRDENDEPAGRTGI